MRMMSRATSESSPPHFYLQVRAHKREITRRVPVFEIDALSKERITGLPGGSIVVISALPGVKTCRRSHRVRPPRVLHCFRFGDAGKAVPLALTADRATDLH